jgi:hypothetical protein
VRHVITIAGQMEGDSEWTGNVPSFLSISSILSGVCVIESGRVYTLVAY